MILNEPLKAEKMLLNQGYRLLMYSNKCRLKFYHKIW